MNEIIKSLHERKSVRSFEDRLISQEDKNLIIQSAIQAPTAGNQALYTILDIEDSRIKQELSVLCDNQPFIEKVPMVLIFLADCRKWQDAYKYAGTKARNPGLGDILLACEDALIAAQNSVVAAQSLGIGSCYIGDILENKEKVVKLLKLDIFTIPITMVVYGFPTEQQKQRLKPRRFRSEYIVKKNAYSPLSEEEVMAMFAEQQGQADYVFEDYINAFCTRKYMSDFALEMNRSAGEYLRSFIKQE